MLVAPVVTPVDAVSQLATESVWLPKGKWIEWETGRHFTGPIRIERNFSISQIPVYVPEGAIIPMAPPMSYTGQKPVDPLILTVFPQDPGSHRSTRCMRMRRAAAPTRRTRRHGQPSTRSRMGET